MRINVNGDLVWLMSYLDNTYSRDVVLLVYVCTYIHTYIHTYNTYKYDHWARYAGHGGARVPWDMHYAILAHITLALRKCEYVEESGSKSYYFCYYYASATLLAEW